jgi:Cerato-platanin
LRLLTVVGRAAVHIQTGASAETVLSINDPFDKMMKTLILAAAFLAFTANASPAATSTTSSPTAAVGAPVAAGTSVNVQYDTTYDNSSESINSVACSDGTNGLGTKGYPTLGAVPGFPLVGGAPTIAGWNSPSCGACYAITYGSTTIYVTAVDAATDSFVLSQQAMDRLTNNQAVALGHVTATYAVADAASCGFPTTS